MNAINMFFFLRIRLLKEKIQKTLKYIKVIGSIKYNPQFLKTIFRFLIHPQTKCKAGSIDKKFGWLRELKHWL